MLYEVITQQRQGAAAWLKAAPNRWVLGQARELANCFDPAQGQLLGTRHGGDWTLYRADAVKADCPTPVITSYSIHYTKLYDGCPALRAPDRPPE